MKKSLFVLSFISALLLTISCITADDTTMYDVSVTVSPEGAGTISPTTSNTYEDGEEIELQAHALEGYVFSGWTGDIEKTDNPLSVIIDKTLSLTANFEQKTYDLSITTVGNGTVSETIFQQKSSYTHGTVVELNALAAEGWSFAEWQGDLNGTQNPTHVNIDKSMEVTAIFEQLDFYLAENGVTVMCPEAVIGDTGVLNGVKYTKRSADQITVDNATTTCTSGITDMSSLFYNTTTFNENINHWDVSDVINMSNMFSSAEAFNREISSWDVSNVETMSRMFSAALSFNQDLNEWDVSGVTNMKGMFSSAKAFNQDISKWDVSSVNTMANMFKNTSAFNQDLSGWNVSSVIDMSDMFYAAEAFNGNINSWDVSNVEIMRNMFRSALVFNQDLSNWDVSSVTIMTNMFSYAEAFNQDIGNWDVSSVGTTKNMFQYALAFNQDLGSWDVSSVTDMYGMFDRAQSFNQDIGNWDVSNVTEMSMMFYGIVIFNQDLSGWCVENIPSEPDGFSTGSGLTSDHMPVWGTCP